MESNTRNLSIQLSLSQTSKNAVFLIISYVFSEQNWRTRGGTGSAWKWVAGGTNMLKL
jgi:hypothetical protein